MEQWMKLTGKIAVVFAIAAIALAGAACGGDDDNGGAPGTATPEVTSDPSGNVTPFPTPLINGNSIVSDSKGYSVTLPQDWKPRINFIQTIDSSVDAFFEPLAPDAKAQTNIAITCTVPGQYEEQERIDLLKTTTARQGLNENIVVGSRTIDGKNVTTLTYTNVSQQNPNQPRLGKTDYLFSTSKCDYTITTLSLEEDRAKYQPIFDTFLDSVKLIQ
jgi:hypothetical protein